MNHLKMLTGDELIQNAMRIAAVERKLNAELLEYLREISDRLLHLQLGYSSLHDFVVRHFGYSDSCAHYRISTMRLSRDLPEVVAAI
ncbi:MAG: hypothetical protein ACXWP5_02445 [Bdellovibrionota bacterium]